jgi:hypothetical protein
MIVGGNCHAHHSQSFGCQALVKNRISRRLQTYECPAARNPYRRKQFAETMRNHPKKTLTQTLDDPVKSPNLDGFGKCSRSRLANPEE